MVQGYDQLISRVLYGTLTDQQGQGFPAVLLGGNMQHLKRVGYILIITAIFVMLIAPLNKGFISDADDIYQPLHSESDLVLAFQAYCKSRDLTIEGSSTDVITTFTTSAFNGLCNSVGIDITELQAEIKAEYDNSGRPVKFLYNSTGVGLFNRIFAQFLQDNELQVGDSADQSNNTVYSGDLVYDAEGNSALAFILNTTDTYNGSGTPIAKGSYYKYSNADLINMFPYHSSGETYYGYIPYKDANGDKSVEVRISNYSDTFKFITTNASNFTQTAGIIQIITSRNNYNGGYFIISKVGNTYYAGVYSDRSLLNIDTSNESISNNPSWRTINSFIPSDIDDDVIVFLTTNNNIINNNNYEGDTYITNEGDVITNEGDSNIDYNPYPDGGSSTTGPSTGNGGGGTDGTINIPDLNFDLPEINWSLGDLSDKFPFSIPFDLIAFFTVMNADPVAPAIDKEIPLGDWYTWHFEADFSQFDDYAVIIRNVEFIGFVIALIYITIRLVKG